MSTYLYIAYTYNSRVVNYDRRAFIRLTTECLWNCELHSATNGLNLLGLLNPEECFKSACTTNQLPAVDNCYPADNYNRIQLYRSWNTSCPPLLPDLDTSFTYPWDYHGSWHYGSWATLKCLPGYVLPSSASAVSTKMY